MSHTKEFKSAIKMFTDNADSPLSDYASDECIIEAFSELEQRNAELVDALVEISKTPSPDCNPIFEVNIRLDIADKVLAKAKEAK